jgi:hypothetical protein
MVAMNSNLDEAALKELDVRIAAARENIRNLVEQAAAYSGAADEDRTANRLAEQERVLVQLLQQRDTFE